MKEISIGILIPTSGILPMGKQFDRSFKKALKEELNDSDYDVEIFTEIVGQGTPVLVEKALDQFFGYHEVDAVCGLCTAKAMEGVVEKFNKRKVPLIINNLGEHFVPTNGYNNHVLINSTHLWQHCWAMGKYAAENLGKKGLILGSMFDSGYSFVTSFQLGLISVNEGFDHDLRLLPMPQPGQLSQIREAFDTLNWEEYDFVFPLFCGEEATIFIEEFLARNLKTKIIGLPYILEIGANDLSGLEVISTLQESINEDFLWRNVFAKMGENSGKALGKALNQNGEMLNPEILLREFRSIDPTLEYDSTQIPRVMEKIKLIKHSVTVENQVDSEMIALVEANLKDDPKIIQSRDSITSSWMNSYLAV